MSKVISIVLFLLVSSCAQITHGPHRDIASVWVGSKKKSLEFHAFTAEDNEQFQELIEQNLVWREKALSFYQEITQFRHDHPKQPLPSILLTRMHRGLMEYQQVYNKMVELIDETNWLVGEHYKIILTSKRVTSTEEQLRRERQLQAVLSPVEEGEVYQQPFYLNPHDWRGQIILAHLKRSFAASLVLFDNYTAASYLYANDRKLRQILNFDNKSTMMFITEQEDYFTKYENRERIAVAIKLYQRLQQFQRGRKQLVTYDDVLIIHSPFYQNFYSVEQQRERSLRLDRIRNTIKDYSDRVMRVTSFGLSKFFGNSLGIFASRKGKMLKLSKRQLHKIKRKLQPLDILLEKTPFRLTDKFIPGHFGHVAVWVGNEKELRALGIWDSAEVRPYQKLIRSGHLVLEALRPGVQLNTLHHFMNIDDFAVVRAKHLSVQDKKRYLLNGFRQVGKSYDFNFDVETDKRIVCSELAYVVFDDMQWPTEKTLGRSTISPDNVAFKAIDGGPFYPVMLFHDGKEIKGHIERNFKLLLHLKYDQITFK